MLRRALSCLLVFHPDHPTLAGSDDPEGAAGYRAFVFVCVVVYPLALAFRFRIWEHL